MAAPAHASMPRALAVTCPGCRGEARFAFAEVRRISAQDAPKARRLDGVDVRRVCQHGWKTVAMLYPGLLRSPEWPAIMEGSQPPIGAPGTWQLSGAAQNGTIVCALCGLRRRHRLAWPEDAFFQVEHRGRVLWAFDRQMAIRLLRYLAAGLRDRSARTDELRKVPTVFLTRNARRPLVQKLRRVLGSAPS